MAELTQFHVAITQGKGIKTMIADAMEDLEVFQMILKRVFPLEE